MHRRTLLAAIGGLAATGTGCLGDTSGSARPPESGSPTATVDASLDVPPCPTFPATFDRERAIAFAAQFERAYVTRTTLRGHDDIVSISVSTDATDATARETDAGWRVSFTVVGPAYRVRVGPTRTEHADPPLYTASYLLTDDEVFRAAGVEERDPRVDGSEVHCPPT